MTAVAAMTSMTAGLSPVMAQEGRGGEAEVGPVCIAHRGNNVAKLENSMAALVSAVHVGAPAVEFDLHHTRDGVAILMHDGTLFRTVSAKEDVQCPVFRKISELTYREIWRACRLSNGEEIPTLDMVLEYFRSRDTTLVVELKDTPNERTLGLMADHYVHRPDRMKVISFSQSALERARTSPEFSRMIEMGVELFHLSRDPDDVCTEFGGVSVNKPSRAWVHAARQAGYRIGVWTVNSWRDLRRYFEYGVDFITSDDPARCLKVAREFAGRAWR